LQFTQANAQAKNCKRACFSIQIKIVFPFYKKNKKEYRKQENTTLKDGQPVTSVLQDSG